MSITKGLSNIIDSFFDLDNVGSSPHYRHKASSLRLAAGNLPSVDGRLLLQQLYDQIEENRHETVRPASIPPSEQNWILQSNPVYADENTSPEVTLERELIRSYGDGLYNQVSTSSGLIDARLDKARNIDLVLDLGGRRYEFIELKVGSNTPLYAAMEVVTYALIYLFSRRHADSLGYSDLPLISSHEIALRVLAPYDYYEDYDLGPLERLLNVGFARLLATDLWGGISMSFDFERFPESFYWPERCAASDRDDLAATFKRRTSVPMCRALADEVIMDAQRRWAVSAEVDFDTRNDRTKSIEDNLFRPLNKLTASEFSEGAGNELGTPDKPGNLYALRSSAALACNVFDYWRHRDPSPILSAVDADPRANSIQFEQQFPTGLLGHAPHLDVLLSGGGAVPTAIESKFTEIYRPLATGGTKPAFADSYFELDGLWDDMPRCRSLAAQLNRAPRAFVYLDAKQLIKHALGLQTRFGRKGYLLLYLWYEHSGEEAQLHRIELENLLCEITDEVNLVALTYQQVFARLQLEREGHGNDDYLAYLGSRYFSDVIDGHVAG